MTKLTKEILEEFDEKFCYPKGHYLDGLLKSGLTDKNIHSFLQEVVKRVREETLEDYTKFLGKYHYLDSDVWAEEPSAIDRYLSELNKGE